MTLREVELHNASSMEQLDQEELDELLDVAGFVYVGGSLFNAPVYRYQDYTKKYMVAVKTMQGLFIIGAFTNKNRLYNMLECFHTDGYDIIASIIGVRV